MSNDSDPILSEWGLEEGCRVAAGAVADPKTRYVCQDVRSAGISFTANRTLASVECRERSEK